MLKADLYTARAVIVGGALGSPELAIIRPDGTHARVLVRISQHPLSKHPTVITTFEGPVFAPDGAELAYVKSGSPPPPDCRGCAQAKAAIVLIDAHSGRQRLTIPLPGFEPLDALPVAFSPDSSELAFAPRGAAAISIVDVHTGRRIGSIRSCCVTGISWSVDGTIAFAASNGSIYTVNPSGAQLHQIAQPPPQEFSR
jgi:hypothetical protein